MKITRRQLRRIIKEYGDPSAQKADLFQTVKFIVDSGSSAIMDMAGKLQGMGFPDAEYISGMGMRYVEVMFKGKKYVIISKNQVEADPDTRIIGPYAIGVMS